MLADGLRGLTGSPGSERIGDVRGRGLAIGLELVDPETGGRDPRLAAQVVYRAWELGAAIADAAAGRVNAEEVARYAGW